MTLLDQAERRDWLLGAGTIGLLAQPVMFAFDLLAAFLLPGRASFADMFAYSWLLTIVGIIVVGFTVKWRPYPVPILGVVAGLLLAPACCSVT